MTFRKVLSLFVGLVLVLFVSVSALAADEQLYGTWRLVSFQRTIADTGEKKDLFGKSPQGLIIYGRDGRMLVLMVSDQRPKPPDLAKVTDQERIDLFKTMLAYGGTYNRREDDKTSGRSILERKLDRHRAGSGSQVRGGQAHHEHDAEHRLA